MATPSFNLNLNVISACDADDWDGGVGILDTVIYKQNNASLSLAVRDGGTAGITGTWDMSATDAHIRMWVIHTFVTNLETKANGGIQLYVSDGVNTNYYYVSGSDTHPGSWELVQADLANPDIDGSTNLASITEFGWEIVHATAARNIVNTWWDYCVYGTGYEVKGGTNVDKVTWATLAAADLALGYGVVTLDRGVFFVNAEIILGDTIGTSDLYFDGDGALVVFYSANESAGLYKIVGDGNSTGTTDITMNGTVIKSDSNRFGFDMDAANLGALSMSGSKLDHAGLNYFKTGQSITNCVFNDCLQVDPGLSTFDTNSFTNSTATDGSLYWPSNDSGISDISFLICDNDIEIDASSDAAPTFTNIIHDNNAGDYDVNNTSGSAVSVSLAGTSNGNSYNPGGNTVAFDSSSTLSMTVKDQDGVSVTGAYAYIDKDNTAPYIMNNTTSTPAGVASESWTGGAVTGATWRVRKYGYKPYKAIADVPASGEKDIPVTLIADPQQT